MLPKVNVHLMTVSPVLLTLGVVKEAHQKLGMSHGMDIPSAKPRLSSLFTSRLTVRTLCEDRSSPNRDEATPPLATCSVAVRPALPAPEAIKAFRDALGGRTGTPAATPLSARACIPRKYRLFGIFPQSRTRP